MFSETLTDFINPETPGYVTCTVNGVAGGGLFDNPTANAFGLLANTDPQLQVIAADFPAAAVGQSVVINAATYTVTRVEPDGHGLTMLVLK